MKTIISSTILMTVLFSCSNSVDENTLTKKIDIVDSTVIKKEFVLDSVTIQDKFAQSPFDKINDLNYFANKLKQATNVKTKLLKDYMTIGSTDTIKETFWGNSFIQTLGNRQVNKDAYLLSVVINDNNISINKDIKIGQTAEAVFKIFNAKFDKTKKYKFLQVDTPSDMATSTLTFYFKDNVLIKIDYSPYTG